MSDNPLVCLGDLDDGGYILVLPLSPRSLFACASTSADLALMTGSDSRKIVKATNRQLVRQASRFVYATSQHHEPLVRKHLRRLPEDATAI